MREVLPGEGPLALVGHGRFFNALCDLLGVEPITQIPNGVPLCCVSVAGTEMWKIEQVVE
jgi:hypothetical protein